MPQENTVWSSGEVLNDVAYSKELSAYTREKLNVYLELLNKGEYLGYGNDRYTNEKLKSKLDEIDARCQKETGYKYTVYMISGKDTNGNMQVDYSILYKTGRPWKVVHESLPECRLDRRCLHREQAGQQDLHHDGVLSEGR